MLSDDFLGAIRPLLDTKSVQSLGAQTTGDKLVREALESLAGYVGYRPLYVPRVAKSRTRLLQKARDLKQANPALTAQDTIDLITDLAAGRLLVIGLQDVQVAHSFLTEYASRRRDFKLEGKPESSVEAPKTGGFRALKQNLSIELADRSAFPFELQIMTLLQHNWDQLQHRIYEMIRQGAGGTIPSEVTHRFEELSARLYELDGHVDQIKRIALL